ncbi:hypothetical protein H5410_024193 [Solanum commersonii]|uniref:Uncharacterized protein n=1 Tax=Solanum commersonii TaxID=4109 RepID=A0A9J5ZLB0_SOLCO|nr:hypothetical protein H5410_024193 [Solanum commersonii]
MMPTQKNSSKQNFNIPTDMFLSKMKHGKNFQTGKKESGYPQALVKHGTSVLGRSGPWNGLHWSGDHAPSSSQSSIYKIQFFGVIKASPDKQWLYAKPHVRESDQELALPHPGTGRGTRNVHEETLKDFHARTGLIQNEDISISHSFSREIL